MPNFKVLLADLGLAKPVRYRTQRKSHSVVSLFQRAPETILKGEAYFTSVDIWAMGCILVELLAVDKIPMLADKKHRNPYLTAEEKRKMDQEEKEASKNKKENEKF
jgi:serine/threonine protein kinase